MTEEIEGESVQSEDDSQVLISEADEQNIQGDSEDDSDGAISGNNLVANKQVTDNESSDNILRRRNAGDYDNYLKDLDIIPQVDQMTDNQITQSFSKFVMKRRKMIFNDLNEAEQERYNVFMESFGQSTQKKVESFISSLPGASIKIPQPVLQVITSAAKIHAGQLIEHAKQIQIEALKNKLAFDYPVEKINEGQQYTPNGVVSKKAEAELKKQVENNLGSCSPWHMREANRRMMQVGEYVDSKPPKMFLRK